MPPFICVAAVLLALMCCLPKGLSLSCHYCESYGGSKECLKSSGEICEPGQDVCTIQTTWRGSLYNDMTIVKSCSTSNECPSDNKTTPSCYKYDSSWFCTLCCKENLCNVGANGKVPRPPPYPPVPSPLIQRLTRDCDEGMGICTTTLRWSEEYDKVHINKHCTASSEHFEYNILNHVEKCNIPADPGYCVTCCHDDDCLAHPNHASASNGKSYQQTLLVLCLLTKWLS